MFMTRAIRDVRAGIWVTVVLAFAHAELRGADDLLISEFAATNQQGLADDDGDYSDWIEIHNAGASAVNLAGWRLTDDPANLAHWTFPSVSLPAGGYLVVFASGKDRRDGARPLHTNFELLQAGEYLGLIAPDGVTIVHQFAPAFPPQEDGFSYGLKQDSTLLHLVTTGGPAKALVPASSALGLTWTQTSFNDASWASGTSGVGYDNNPDYLSLIGLNVDAAMDGISSSAYSRFPFSLASTAGLSGLFLRMKYDDGYVAYLNGTRVSTRNAPASPAWDSAATAQHDDAAAVIFEEEDVSASVGLLRNGQNVLAIHGMNSSTTSSDFLVLPELDAYAAGTLDRTTLLYFPTPSPGLGNLPGFPGVSAAPLFSRQSGLISSSFNLTLSSPSAGASIRYTTDRSEPTQSSTLYTGPIAISATTMVRARAFEAGEAPSAVVTQTYVVLAASVRTASSNLPLLVVDTFGVGVNDSLWTPGFAAVIAPGADGRAALSATPDLAVRCAIKTRGSSSLGFPKKSYALEVRDERGDDLDVPVLGLPSESDWILYGPYTDKTLMRDQLSYLWSNRIGRYASRTQFIEAYVNSNGGNLDSGDYVGVYMLTEKIKRSEDRVDIARLDASDNAAPQVTGGYILKKDRLDPGDAGLTTSRGHVLGYVYPKEQIVTPEQRAYIQGFLNEFETALYGAGYANPTTGYAKYIDVDSFIDHHMLVELAKNIDGYRLSTFMHKDRDGKLTMGPIWDYNLSLGNANYLEGWIPQGWYYPLLGAGDYPWYARLFQDVDFAQRYIDRWTRFRKQPLATDLLLADIEANAVLLDESRVRNFNKWNIIGSYVWPNWYIGTSYEEEVIWMAEWLNDRLIWWDSQYTRPPVLNKEGGQISPGFQLTMTSTPAGTPIYFTLDGQDPRRPGGAKLASAGTYSGPIALTQNTRVLARAKPAAGGWSGLVDVTFVVTTPPLVITEIMYHPLDTVASDVFAGEDYELIELMNRGSEPLELAGFTLAGGISFTFPTGLGPLEPLEHVVVVKNLAAFTQRYGLGGIRVAGEYQGSLGNGGDHLILSGPLQEPILDFAYSDDWYPSTDGLDDSLTIVDPDANLDTWGLATSWKVSSVAGGTPGFGDSGTAGGLQRVGDANQDGGVDIADAVALLHFLFSGTRALPCEGDSPGTGGNLVVLDENGDGAVNLTDAIHLLNFLFKGGEGPAGGGSCRRIQGCPSVCR